MCVIDRVARLEHFDMRNVGYTFYRITIGIVELVDGAAEVAAFGHRRFADKGAINYFDYRQCHQRGEQEAEDGACYLFFAGNSFEEKQKKVQAQQV